MVQLLEEVVEKLTPRRKRDPEETKQPPGLKKLTRNRVRSGPSYECGNCKCLRYNPCKCRRR